MCEINNGFKELVEDYYQLMELYQDVKSEIKRRDKRLFERWKAGGFIIDEDILSMYPNLTQCIESLDEEN